MATIIEALRGARTYYRCGKHVSQSTEITAERVVDITDECPNDATMTIVVVYARDSSGRLVLLLKRLRNKESLIGITEVIDLQVYRKALYTLVSFRRWADFRGIRPERLSEIVLEFAPEP